MSTTKIVVDHNRITGLATPNCESACAWFAVIRVSGTAKAVFPAA